MAEAGLEVARYVGTKPLGVLYGPAPCSAFSSGLGQLLSAVWYHPLAFLYKLPHTTLNTRCSLCPGTALSTAESHFIKGPLLQPS